MVKVYTVHPPTRIHHFCQDWCSR